MALKTILQQKQIDSESLDDIVTDAALRDASRVNNEGLSEQLEYLNRVGISDNTILESLGLK